jgi:uncharacterized membrane protein
MFPTVAGLPAHPLIVHLTVVLVPLAALGALIVALRPRARARFGTAALGGVVAAVIVAAVAEESGQALAAQLPASPQINAHAALGESLPPLLALTALLLGGLLLVDRAARRRASAPSRPTDAPGSSKMPGAARADAARRTATGPAAVVLAVVLALTSVAGLVQVVRAGDAGARATWGGVAASQSPAEQ